MSSNTTEHGEHFNESIVNEVILEDMKKNRIDHMKYLPGMETMEESDVMEQVITAMNAYDYDKYTEVEVPQEKEVPGSPQPSDCHVPVLCGPPFLYTYHNHRHSSLR